MPFRCSRTHTTWRNLCKNTLFLGKMHRFPPILLFGAPFSSVMTQILVFCCRAHIGKSVSWHLFSSVFAYTGHRICVKQLFFSVILGLCRVFCDSIPLQSRFWVLLRRFNVWSCLELLGRWFAVGCFILTSRNLLEPIEWLWVPTYLAIYNRHIVNCINGIIKLPNQIIWWLGCLYCYCLDRKHFIWI